MPELAGPAEIVEQLNISRATLYLWMNRPGFPEPLARLKAGPVWDMADIQEWRADDPKARKPYRPRTKR